MDQYDALEQQFFLFLVEKGKLYPTKLAYLHLLVQTYARTRPQKF